MESSITSFNKWTLGNVITVELSEIVDGTTCYVHEVDNTDALSSFIQELTAFATNVSLGISFSDVKKSQIIATLYEEVSSKIPGEINRYWCRARIEEITPSSLTILYIDYGNK